MRRALGKGLSQLIADQFEGAPSDVALDDIVPNPRQPRRHFDEAALQELANSIREFGVLQPLLVKPIADGKYELIAGERRLRASRIAGRTTVPVLQRSANNQGSLELALVENVQREDINPLEAARAYRRLVDEFSLTQEQVAERVGKSRVTIANTMRLLRLPKRVQEGLESARISEGHARALLAFESEAQQLAVYDQILERGLTVREVEKASKGGSKPAAPAKSPNAVERDPNDVALEEGLSERVGGPVRLLRAERGGKLVFEFFSDEDLTHILDKLGFEL